MRAATESVLITRTHLGAGRKDTPQGASSSRQADRADETARALLPEGCHKRTSAPVLRSRCRWAEIAMLEGARHEAARIGRGGSSLVSEQGAATGDRRASLPDLTVIVPAYNEAETLADTVRSLKRQTVSPDKILVVDDCSTDATAEVAESLGVAVLRPPENTGSKAGAQSFALERVDTGLVMAIDADTALAPDAIERMLPAFDDPRVACA